MVFCRDDWGNERLGRENGRSENSDGMERRALRSRVNNHYQEVKSWQLMKPSAPAHVVVARRKTCPKPKDLSPGSRPSIDESYHYFIKVNLLIDEADRVRGG